MRSRHRRTAAAPAAALWDAANHLLLADTRRLGALVRWRLPGTPAEQSFSGLLEHHPFVVLDRGDGWSLSGLCGRIWTLAPDYPELETPEAFRAWSAPGTVRVLFAHWVEPDASGSAIVSEARVAPVDRGAAIALRSLWLIVSPFERLIGAEPLTLAAQRATRASRRGA